MRKTKAEKGITLVALIITIIVLLILAAVAISAVRNDGIIEYAKNARNEYEKAQSDEQAGLDYYLGQIESSKGEVVIVHNGIIPKGAIYYVGVESTEGLGNKSKEEIEKIAKHTYVPGDKFPEPTQGDIYVYGYYEYRYKMYYDNNNVWSVVTDSIYEGWGVRVLDANQNKYGDILTTINNKNVLIMMNTFRDCTKLISAPNIPNTVINMNQTFRDCTNLVDVSAIPDSVIKMISAFANCGRIETMPSIGKNVTDMKYAFYGCTNLKNVSPIPNSVTDMSYAFNYCKALNSMPIIGTGVTNMDHTFSACHNLEKITDLPDGLLNMNGTFRDCPILNETPKIPSTVEKMDRTFQNCSKLKTAPEIPASVKYMNRTFWYCAELTGDIVIKTSKVEDVLGYYEYCFDQTKKTIKLYGIDSDGDEQWDNLNLLENLRDTQLQGTDNITIAAVPSETNN